MTWDVQLCPPELRPPDLHLGIAIFVPLRIQGHCWPGTHIHRTLNSFYLQHSCWWNLESSFISAVLNHFVTHCPSTSHGHLLLELPHSWQLQHSVSWYWHSHSKHPEQAFTLLPNWADWVIWGTLCDSALFICSTFLAAVSIHWAISTASLKVSLNSVNSRFVWLCSAAHTQTYITEPHPRQLQTHSW